MTVRLAALVLTAWIVAGAAAAADPAPELTVAAVGDLTYLRPARAAIEAQAPGVASVLRGADAAFGNFETSSFTTEGFTGSPQIKSTGPLVLAWPGAAAEMRALGFDLMSQANNHAFDFGEAGLLGTAAVMDAAGLVHAGAGPDERAARAPRYFQSPKGRVGLVAATAFAQAAAPAADPYGPLPAHPGVSILRTTRTARVAPDSLEALRRIAAAAPRNTEDNGVAPPGGVRLLGQNFAAGPPGSPLTLSFEMNPADAAAILAAVAESRRTGALTLLSLHTHEPTVDVLEPADFTVALAHRAIDAGADAFLGHGAHQLRGIEIYKGRPVFYGLGNFAIMLPTPDLNPGGFALKVENGRVVTPSPSLFSERAFFESVAAVSRFAGRRLVEVRLYPFELVLTGDPATHGLPRAVQPAAARAILERLQQLSRPFGTVIAIENGVGVIRP
jgi:poly-gamma-glutamate synthesis protein (capsule biosynthesis protein)